MRKSEIYFRVFQIIQNIHLKENAEKFRSHVLSKLGAFSLDNPGTTIIYTDVLDGITKQLKESFRNEQKKIISTVGKNLLFYFRELQDLKEGKASPKTGLTEQGRKQIDGISYFFLILLFKF